MYNETVSLLIANGTFVTTRYELVPRRSPSGMLTGVLLLNRITNPGVPDATMNWFVTVFWSDLTTKEKLIGIPQLKVGPVLILNGTRLVPDMPIGISGYPAKGCAMITPGVVLESVARTPVAPTLPVFVNTIDMSLHSLNS